MKGKSIFISVSIATTLAALATGAAISGEDKATVKVPGGIALSECKGYESWETISLSLNGGQFALIVGNPEMIKAFKAGIPENGKPFPDGAKMAKIHWTPKTQAKYPGPPQVPGTQSNADCMVKDSKRFADSGGWGYGAFAYDAKTDTFTPADMTSKPPQGNDAKCGFACHTVVKDRDYVFTEYAHR